MIVDQQQPEQIDGVTSAEPRADWTRPQVDRLIAGGAEGSADISTDGIDVPS
ncbi:MAG TPA: hypothetical protein VEA61_02390 [Allosphingosinicella sp.]|nr:hypothetical protein [Allosphingosinicella sp.]